MEEENTNIRKTALIYELGHEPDDTVYWLSQSPEDRIAAVEALRRQYYGNEAINARIQRVYRIVKLEQS